MEIKELKKRLSMGAVLSHYGLVVEKNRLCCPFHADTTPSMQYYPKTETVYCFSASCSSYKQSLDIIGFIEKKEQCTTKEAFSKALSLLGETPVDRLSVLREQYGQYVAQYGQSSVAQVYMQSRSLVGVEVGYCAGDEHKNQPQNYLQAAEQVGLVKRSGKGLAVFGRESVVFALRDAKGQVVSLYFRSITADSQTPHLYLKERQGLYPQYPAPSTQILILTESVVDAASLEQYSLPVENYSVLALYGTNGWTSEHDAALSSLPDLQEVILFLDGDAAGQSAVARYAKEFSKPGLQVSYIQTPEGEDINSLAVAYDEGIFYSLVQKRQLWGEAVVEAPSVAQAQLSLFESETSVVGESVADVEALASPAATDTKVVSESRLQIVSQELFVYLEDGVRLSVLGGIRLSGLDKLKVTLKVEKGGQFPLRHSVDLYHAVQVEQLASKLCDTLQLHPIAVRKLIENLTGELEHYRERKLAAMQPQKKEPKKLTDKEIKEALTYLKDPNLLENTSRDIGRSGVVGEEENRLLAYLIYTSRKREQPLHLMCLGSSGSGKTHLQERVSRLIPEEERLEITALSDNAFYYFGRNELSHKLLLLEDLDGAEGVMYALRELQSKQCLTKDVTLKNAQGNMRTVHLQVEGPVSISSCTTREKLYEDNANRCILLYIDASKEQDERILHYHKLRSAGQVNRAEESQLQTLFQNCQRLLKPVTVRNPYAPAISLPDKVFKPRRTMGLLLSFIETVTFYHQHQLEKKRDSWDGEVYIETTIEHIRAAFGLLKQVLFHKSDELSGACRGFLEQLKAYLCKEGQESFYAKEVRMVFRLAPATLSRYLFDLERYGYIKSSGNKHRGYSYTIVNVGEYGKLQSGIEEHLNQIIKQLETSQTG